MYHLVAVRGQCLTFTGIDIYGKSKWGPKQSNIGRGGKIGGVVELLSSELDVKGAKPLLGSYK